MPRRPFAVLFVFALVVASVALSATQPACTEVPNQTCFGDKVNALTDDGGTDPRATGCTSCMQQTACCDVLGACSDDLACTGEFKQMQRCMLERPGKEAECKALLSGSASRELYACMRKPCGKSCGVPSCDLDPAVTLFVSPTCDRCIGSACCEQINACYGNRQCKLFLECVSDRCPKTVGASITGASAVPADVLATFEAAVCGDAGAAALLTSASPVTTGACLDRCLDEFARPKAGLVEANREATCLALGVYACGARNQCGPSCTVTSETPTGAYPEDDAGTRDGGAEGG